MDLVAVLLELDDSGVVLFLARSPDADVGAGFGHGVGHAEADAAVAAGHQCHLARQIEALVGHAMLLPFGWSMNRKAVAVEISSACRFRPAQSRNPRPR